MWRTAPGPGGRRRRVILGVETSCDDTCAAVVTRRRARCGRTWSPRRACCTRRYGGVVPEVASRHHLELIDAVIADALERRGRRPRRRGARGGDPRPGPDRRAAGGRVGGQGAGRRARAAARRRSTTCTATWWPARSGHDPIEPPYLCLVASGGHTFLARVDEPGSYAVLGQTLDDAAGEAFDKGARLLGPAATPAGPSSTGWRATGDPDAFDFPRSAPGDGLDFSLQRAQDRAALRGCATWEAGGRAPRRPGRLLPAGDRRRADAPGRAGARARGPASAWPSAAAWPPTPSCASCSAGGDGRARWVPPLELCTDNAAMIAGAARFLEPVAYPDYLDARRGRRGCHDRA